MKKNIVIGSVIAVILCFFLIIFINQDNTLTNNNKRIVSGTFSGKSEGDKGTIHVDVVIENNAITHIEIIEHNETPGFSKAMVLLSDDIIAKNSLDVDLISGATKTSESFIKAIKETLRKAGIAPEDLAKLDEVKRIKNKKYSNTNCDILIIGGGGAGFTAAIEALSTGNNSVIVLEKMSFGGGNTRMSGGEYAAPGNWVQLDDGITQDSKELFFNDIYEGGGKKGNPELIRILVENALPNAYWLKDFVGVDYRDYQSWYGGHSLSRTLWPIGDGPEYVDTLISKAETLGADIHYNTRAEKLLQDSSGKVIGVRAKRGDNTIDYVAKKGVILATGGFGANVDMRMKHDNRWKSLDENIPTTNSPAIVGDGLIMAEAIGANLVGLGDIQLYPINNPATGNYYFIDYARINSNALLLNQEGKRFVDEKETRDNISEAMLRQTDAKAYELIDSAVIREMNLEHIYANELAKCYEQGVLVKGSLEECSDYFNLPIDEVKKTISRYNKFAMEGKDLDFNRTEHLDSIGQGPYFMFSCILSVHYTIGGVEIDKYARVINKEGKPIKGLYAAGEVTGGIHGSNRLGSLSIPDTVAFGRIAARSASNGF